MKWFYNLKVSAKLIIGFLTVAVIAGVIGIVGVVNIKNIDNADTQLYEEHTLGLDYIGISDVYFQRVRANIFKMMLVKDLNERTEIAEKINTYIETADEHVNNYEDRVTDEDDRTMFNEMKPLWVEYKSIIERAMNLVQSNKIEEAQNLVIVDSATTIDTLQEKIDKIFEYNATEAKEKSDDNTKTANAASQTMVVVILIGILIAISLGIFISQIISKPLKKMTDAAQKLALGDVNVKIEATTKDEIGNLMQALSKMVENIREQAYATEKIAEGDMTVQVKVKSENDLMGKKLTEMININNEVLCTISAAAAQVAAGAKQVSATSQMLSQGSTEQASSIEEITASMAQVSDQTKKNAINSNQANELALAAKENALKGNSQMQEMIKAMAEINESSTSISKIIKVIDDIAFQTNILALNAAVEAARAGQHGKGFAVVADEVRNLAARSATAAKETTELIENSIKKVEAGSQIANNTGEALNEIVNGVSKAADLVGNIASASNEQASGIAQINQAISQVAQVVQNNSATAEESASASEELSSQAEVMKESVSRFKLKTVRGNLEIGGLDSDTIRAIENIVDKKKSYRNFEQSNSYIGEDIPVKSNLKSTISLDNNDFGKY